MSKGELEVGDDVGFTESAGKLRLLENGPWRGKVLSVSGNWAKVQWARTEATRPWREHVEHLQVLPS